MSSDKEFLDYVLEQISGAGVITYKKMFGEYGLYCNSTFFAMICDNQFFIKTTNIGMMLLKNPDFASPYPNAKKCFLITDFVNKELLYEVINQTCKVLKK